MILSCKFSRILEVLAGFTWDLSRIQQDIKGLCRIRQDFIGLSKIQQDINGLQDNRSQQIQYGSQRYFKNDFNGLSRIQQDLRRISRILIGLNRDLAVLVEFQWSQQDLAGYQTYYFNRIQQGLSGILVVLEGLSTNWQGLIGLSRILHRRFSSIFAVLAGFDWTLEVLAGFSRILKVFAGLGRIQ